MSVSIPEADDGEVLTVALDLTDGAVATITAAGELDASTAGALDAALEKAVAAGATEVRVDLSGIEFVDSTGVSSLLAGRTMLEGRGRLTLVACSGAVRRVFDIAGLTSTFVEE